MNNTPLTEFHLLHRTYGSTSKGRPEMQFDIVRQSQTVCNNITVEDAKKIRAILDQFIEQYDTVTIEVPAKDAERVRRYVKDLPSN